MKKLLNPILILILSIFLLMSLSLLLDEPMVWPDEAIYGDISRNLMLENRMGTDLWKGFIEGIENHAYSLPPLYLYTGALWYKIFGFSITNQRLLSVFLGTVFIIIFYFLSSKLIILKNPRYRRLLIILTTLMLATDFVYLKASRLARPEILVLVLSGSSMLTYLQSAKEKLSHRQGWYLLITGLLLGLAIITHLIAVAFTLAVVLTFIYSQRNNLFEFRRYYFLIIGFLLPVLVWLISIYPNYHFLFNQLNLVAISRHYTIPWYTNVLNFPVMMKLNYFFYLLISLIFIIFTFKNRQHTNILICLILISAWIFATLGTLYWYTIYAIPFVYLALFILMSKSFSEKSNKHLLLPAKLALSAVCLFLFYSNISNHIGLFNTYRNTNNYTLFLSQVSKAVPEGKTVYLSSIPDAYYAFNPDKNRLLEFPALIDGLDSFKKTIKEADYIVFNGEFLPDMYVPYFHQYITDNEESVQRLASPYPLIIFKMKDKSLRKDPN